MRRFAFAGLAALLAGCGEAPGGEAVASAPAALVGHYSAVSDTALNMTGDVSIEHAGLMFASGVVLYTRALAPRRGGDLIARDGDSYAATVVGPSELVVELRRVIDLHAPAHAEQPCGAEAPSYVAIAYRARAQSVAVLVFSGEEPPGPSATQSRLCGVYGYASPYGARTQQGVVLY